MICTVSLLGVLGVAQPHLESFPATAGLISLPVSLTPFGPSGAQACDETAQALARHLDEQLDAAEVRMSPTPGLTLFRVRVTAYPSARGFLETKIKPKWGFHLRRVLSHSWRRPSGPLGRTTCSGAGV